MFSNSAIDKILQKSLDGIRITLNEALLLLKEGDFHKVIYTANQIRGRFLPLSDASYTVFRVVNYTNYCNVECKFCSFMDEIDSGKGYVLTVEEIIKKMQVGKKKGANQMFLQGGVYPNLKFDYYLEVLRETKNVFPNLHIRAFSPVELINMSKITRMSLSEVLKKLKEAGLDSVPGAGAEILNERMRKILSPKKSKVDEWIETMRVCHENELSGSANIVFGSEETSEEMLEHLDLVRNLQDETKGFHSFIPWTFQRQTKKFKVRDVSSQEYLKFLGICRIFFDNINHIETSVMVLGKGIGQLALSCGADDISSVVIEENVLRSFGLKSENEAIDFLKNANFKPRKRTLVYDYLND